LHAPKNLVRHGSAAGALPAGRLTRVVESVFIDTIVRFQGLLQDSCAEEIVKNRNDTVSILALTNLGQAGWRREMKDLVRYRAMESLCRQSAVFRPLESWRLLAEAEMWHHKAQEEIASRFLECNGSLQAGTPIETASVSNERDSDRRLAG
jgi:hypothetical protein